MDIKIQDYLSYDEIREIIIEETRNFAKNELKTTQDSKMCIKRLEEGQPIMSEASKIIVRNLEVLNELYKEVERLKLKVDRLGELDVIKGNKITICDV